MSWSRTNHRLSIVIQHQAKLFNTFNTTIQHNDSKLKIQNSEVKVNGEEREYPLGATVLDVVHSIGLTPAQVAVERNLDIVPRATYAQVTVEESDTIEVVTFVGGG